MRGVEVMKAQVVRVINLNDDDIEVFREGLLNRLNIIKLQTESIKTPLSNFRLQKLVLMIREMLAGKEDLALSISYFHSAVAYSWLYHVLASLLDELALEGQLLPVYKYNVFKRKHGLDAYSGESDEEDYAGNDALEAYSKWANKNNFPEFKTAITTELLSKRFK